MSTADQPQARSGSRLKRGVLLALAIGATLYSVIPLWFALVSSVRPEGDIFRYLSPLSIKSIWPTTLTGASFRTLMDTGFGAPVVNSVIVALLTIVIGLILCSAAAFALGVLQFRGQKFLFGVTLVGFLMPFDALAIPLSQVLSGAGFQNTYDGLILPAVGNGLAIFALRQFFRNIPRELLEAAQMDGYGWWRILFRIYLPLSKPALISAALILFVFQWHAFLWPLLIAPDPAIQVAPVAIAQFSQETFVDFGAIFAGTVITAAIPLCLLLYAQKYFVASIAGTGVK
ncbi:carbohydrate ABC transporter permease [Micromonospora sp. B11E3]|uniref:carbohydrate ABC transporter permease n=1 Tax=Micromonospora sp. B11E3 TaxID=3153562 RepID=UPI00325F74E5